MPSREHTHVSPSTVHQTSAGSASCTCGNTSRGHNLVPAGTFFGDYNFLAVEGVPYETFCFTDRSPSPETVQALKESSQDTAAAGEAPVRDSRSENDDEEQKVGTDLPSAVSRLSHSRVIHTARTGNSRDSKSRPVLGRNEQSGMSGSKLQGRGATRAFTRSQGRVPSEEDGASTGGGSTAVGTRIDVELKDIKKERL